MVCTNHSNENGVNTCSTCGEWLCESCSVDINGRVVCKQCIARRMSGSPTPAAHEASAPKRHVSGFLLFIFSFMIPLPGLNYMFMGLMKRGLFFLTAFFSIIFVISITDIGIIGLLIPVLCIGSFFDGFEKRRLINSGAHVSDNVDDIIGWFAKYKVPVIVATVSVFVFSLVSSGMQYLFDVYSWTFHKIPLHGVHVRHMPSTFFAFVLICVGAYYIMKKFANKKRLAEETDRGNQ